MGYNIDNKKEWGDTDEEPVPDVFPDASMVCTLLIKPGDTFKKVC